MAERRAIGLRLETSGPRGEQALADVAAALPDAEVTRPDDTGAFEVRLEASGGEDALQRVFDAIAAAGADDHVVFLEHPDVPEHWRRSA